MFPPKGAAYTVHMLHCFMHINIQYCSNKIGSSVSPRIKKRGGGGGGGGGIKYIP